MTITDGMQNIAGIVPDAWCVWRYGKAGKKPPFTITGDMITTERKATQLCTFAEATAAYDEMPANDGIGVFVRAPLVVIDLDKVVTWNDETPVFTDDAQAIMRAFAGAYTEYSPSRTGVHIYLRYDGDIQQTQWQNKNAQWPLPSGGGIEIFTGKMAHSHYITITGDSVTKNHYIIAIQQSEIDDLIAQYDPKASQRTQSPPQATMPVSDTPAPASMPPDTIDTPAPKVATERTYKQERFIGYAHVAWPSMMHDAIEEMANTPDGSRHDTRKRIGTMLGYAYRALEYACIAVGVPSGDAFAEYATHDAVIDAIYNARPVNDKSTAEDERRTIKTAFTKAHAACGGWHQFSGNTPLLDEIMALDNDAPWPPFIDKPYTGHQTAPEAPQRTKNAQSPPQATTHDTAPANALIDFDAGTITPHQDIINKLRNDIEEAKRTGTDWSDDLYTDVATMREHAKDRPRPIIASTENERHLLMPGVCQLAAASKAGKSTIALHFAHAVATGGDVFGSPSYHVHTPGMVVYFDLENAPGITGARIDDTFSTNAMVRFITPPKWHSVLGIAYQQKRDRWSAMQWFISDVLRKWPDVRLIILDNVLQFQPRRQQHETPEDLEERYMMWLAGVAETYKGLCIMLIDHNTKAQSTDNEAIMTAKAQGTFRKQALLSGGVLSVYNAPAKDSMPDGTLKLVTMMRACENTGIHLKRDDTRGHHTLVDVDPLPLSIVQRRIYEAIRAGNIRKPDIDNALPTMSAQHLSNELNKMVAKGVIYRPRHGEYAISGASYTQTATENDAT
jgi:hypothetical protein